MRCWGDQWSEPHWRRLAQPLMVSVLVAAALLGPLLSERDPNDTSFDVAMTAPSLAYPCASDEFGRDIQTRTLMGLRVSLAIAGGAVAFAVFVGVTLGMLSGVPPRRP